MALVAQEEKRSGVDGPCTKMGKMSRSSSMHDCGVFKSHSPLRNPRIDIATDHSVDDSLHICAGWIDVDVSSTREAEIECLRKRRMR